MGRRRGRLVVASRRRLSANCVDLGSNPRRYRYLAGFQDRCIQPLCHLSSGVDSTCAETKRGAWRLQREHPYTAAGGVTQTR